MTKEHKKLYKAGKNWVVATLTATTITLVGGIGTYTAHADTTIENTQSIQAEGSNQSSQNNNSNNSVVLNQSVTTQSNSTVKNSQPVQNTPTALTVTAATNNSSELDPNIYGTVQSSQNNNSNNSVVLNQSVTTQSNSTVKNSQPVQNTPTTETAFAATNSSDGLDPSIYGTVNVRDWDYQKDNNLINLTGYHGTDLQHIIIPNLNDFNNASIDISGTEDVGITSTVLKKILGQLNGPDYTVAISKTNGPLNSKVTAENGDWQNVFLKYWKDKRDLVYADLTNLDTSKITNMMSMFACQKN